jgi:hypothetical protein
MEKKKFEQIKKEAVSKVEDGIVKAKIFIERHPVACAIGGTAIGAVIAGAIGKKVGYDKGNSDGYERCLCDEDDWIQGTQDLSQCYINVSDKVKESGRKVSDMVAGAMLMKMEDGERFAVLKEDGKIMVDTDLDSKVKELIDDKFYHPLGSITRIPYDDWMGHK